MGLVSNNRKRATSILDSIIEELATENNISRKKALRIIQSIFENLSEDMRNGNMKGTRILNLGVFKVKPYKLRMFYDKQIKLEEDGNKTKNEG